ncbi:MAG: PAS domain-containing protein [Devosia sp.]
MDAEFSRVADTLPAMIWSMLSDLKLEHANERWCEYIGCRTDELRGISWRRVIHPGDLRKVANQWQVVVASGKPGQEQVRLRRFDGQYRQFLLNVHPLIDEAGAIASWRGVGTDIEDCLQSQHDEDFHQAGLYKFLNAIPTLACLLSPEGALEYVNERTLNYFAASLEELKSWPSSDLVHPADLPVLMATWTRALQNGEPYEIDHRIRRADGMYQWFRIRGLPLRDRAGCITRWFELEIDVDDQTRNQIVLEGENRLLEMIVGGNPLSDLLEVSCQLVEDTIDDCYAIIVLLDPSGTDLELGAGPHLPPAFLTRVLGAPVAADVGPIPMAIELNRQVVAPDLASETRWSETGLPALAVSSGLHACWATPIGSRSQRPLGALAIYCKRPGSPTAQNQALIQRLCNMASINVERHRSRLTLDRTFEELRMSEDRLRATIDAVPGFVWCTAPDGSLEFLNRRYSDFTGQTVEESSGQGWVAKVHPDDVLPLRAYWDGLLNSGQSGSFEARIQRFDGKYRWFLMSALPVFDAAGLVLNWYGQNTDIDERKRNELLLEGEKELLGLIAGGSPLAKVLNAFCELVQVTLEDTLSSVALIDRGRSPTSVDGTQGARLLMVAAPDLTQEMREEIDGRALDADSSPAALCAERGEPVFSPDLAQEMRWGKWRSIALSQGICANLSIPIVDEHGVPVAVFSILYRDPDPALSTNDRLVGQLIHLASIAIVRARSDAELRQSEAFLSHGQQVSRTGTFSWCVSTDEIVWSQQIYDIGEVHPSVKPSFDLIFSHIHPDDSPSLRELFENHRISPGDFEHEHRWMMADGSVKHLHMAAHATWRKDGELEYIGALQDVTQRHEAQQSLDEMRAELTHVARIGTLGMLTASIAHEVNQPLAGIITNSSTCLHLLAKNPPNVEGARETARRAIRDGNRAADVIKRLRSMFSNRDVATEIVDLNEAVREVIAMLQGELQRHKVILHFDFFSSLPLIHGDRVQLQQVILNLVVNASDAMSDITDRPHRLLIVTEPDGSDGVRLMVSDCGTGFRDGDEKRLFEAFYTTKSSGMGMGLLVSRSIVERHGGRLWAIANEGDGATFVFSVPRFANDSSGSGTVFALPRDSADPGHTFRGTL